MQSIQRSTAQIIILTKIIDVVQTINDSVK